MPGVLKNLVINIGEGSVGGRRRLQEIQKTKTFE